MDFQNKIESMAKHSSFVSDAVIEISLKLHQTQDFLEAMKAVVFEIKKICSAEKCFIFTVDQNNQKCALINQNGLQEDYLRSFCTEMGHTPYEVAIAWEKDLEKNDCMILENLKAVEEKEPIWYELLQEEGVKNIVLHEIRYNHILTGYILVENFDVKKKKDIQDIFALISFLIGAVIVNHHMISRLKIMASIDELTQVGNRNAMNERVDNLVKGRTLRPKTMGVVFADLNGLKIINDERGHAAGDRLLSMAASFLNIAFGDYEIYRAGGDEFVILCPEVSKEMLDILVRQLHSLTEGATDVSFAIGTSYAEGAYDICQMLQIADEVMYKDKETYYSIHPERDRRKRNRGEEFEDMKMSSKSKRSEQERLEEQVKQTRLEVEVAEARLKAVEAKLKAQEAKLYASKNG